MKEQSYGRIFYLMLLIGIIGLLSFFIIAAGAAGGM
jgi:hypothetical protein